MLPSLHALHPNVTPTNSGADGDHLSMTDEELRSAVNEARQAVLELEPEWERLSDASDKAQQSAGKAYSDLWFARAGRDGLPPVETLEAEYKRLEGEYNQAKEAFTRANVPYQAAQKRWYKLDVMMDERL